MADQIVRVLAKDAPIKASAISAAAALREETGFFVMEDMERLYPQIQIEKIG